MSTNKHESTNINYNIPKRQSNFKKLCISQWLIEFAMVLALATFFFNVVYCIFIGLVYLVIRALNTDFCRRCLKTLPRDLE